MEMGYEMKPTLHRFLLWLLNLTGSANVPALAGAPETDDSITRFAALLCSHCPAVTFAEAVEVVISVKVDIELPLFARTVSADELNVRDQPGVNEQGNPKGDIVAVLGVGDVVDVWCTRPDDWVLAVWGSNGGWCNSRYLKPATRD